MSDETISDDGPGSDLFDPYETGQWKLDFNQELLPVDGPCPNCNGKGYVVIRVYPWDGCSYDEKPCEFCNPRLDRSDVDDETTEGIDIPF